MYQREQNVLKLLHKTFQPSLYFDQCILLKLTVKHREHGNEKGVFVMV